MRRALWIASVVLLSSACTHEPPPEEGALPKSDQIITEAEIAHSQAQTAYDAIVKLRGNFLTNRGKTTILGNSPAVPNVYLDGQLYGTTSTLKNIPATRIASIRLYRAWEATTKFGASNVAGVIEVLTKM